jgi:hypothetical protein
MQFGILYGVYEIAVDQDVPNNLWLHGDNTALRHGPQAGLVKLRRHCRRVMEFDKFWLILLTRALPPDNDGGTK